MIVDSMTDDEVYQELARDRESLTAWWHHKLEAQRRRVVKCSQFPMKLWFEHTTPRKNRYLIFTRIFNRKMRGVLTGMAVVRLTKDGISVYTTWITGQQLISPMVITPHAFRRYAERMNVQKKGLELIRHYFEHNANGSDSYNQRVHGRSVRWNGEDHRASCIEEGVLLGQMHNGIFIVRTFITYDMCGEIQQDEFGTHRELILTDREMFERARDYYAGLDKNEWHDFALK